MFALMMQKELLSKTADTNQSHGPKLYQQSSISSPLQTGKKKEPVLLNNVLDKAVKHVLLGLNPGAH